MEMTPQNTVWLVPEEAAPCDLYLHFRGKYVLGVAANSLVHFQFLEKIAQAKLRMIYIKKEDLKTFTAWKENRYGLNPLNASPTMANPAKSEGAVKANNKRPELISYLRKTFLPRNQEDKKVVGSLEKAFESFQSAAQSSVLDWYFQQFHEPPTLLFHNGRVALLSLYISHYLGLLSDEENKNLAISSLIHELEGDPSVIAKSITSEVTLKLLEKMKHPFPKEVIQLIQNQDEYCDGTGFPRGLKGDKLKPAIKVFSICNQFDHVRLREGGTRKSKYERTKQKLLKEQTRFDASLLQKIWEICETQLEIT